MSGPRRHLVRLFLGGTERIEAAHALLTVKAAAAERGIGVSLAYQLAHEYLNSGGTTGLPVLRFGTCMRVPQWALNVLISTGRVQQLGFGQTVPGSSR